MLKSNTTFYQCECYSEVLGIQRLDNEIYFEYYCHPGRKAKHKKIDYEIVLSLNKAKQLYNELGRLINLTEGIEENE